LAEYEIRGIPIQQFIERKKISLSNKETDEESEKPQKGDS
jgi:hypothetical protein